jgi:hypothetical protein
VDNGVKDYNLLMEGNKSLLAECNDFHYRCKDLKAELAEVRFDAKKRTANMEAKVMKDQGGDRRGGEGGNGSQIKFFHENLTYVPRSKLQAKAPKRK